MSRVWIHASTSRLASCALACATVWACGGPEEEPAPDMRSSVGEDMRTPAVAADMAPDASEADMRSPADMRPPEEDAGRDMSWPLPFDLGGPDQGEQGCGAEELPEIVEVTSAPEELTLGAGEALTVTLETRCFTPPLAEALVFSHQPRRLLGRAEAMSSPRTIEVTIAAEEFDGFEPGELSLDVSVSSGAETLSASRAVTIQLLSEN